MSFSVAESLAKAFEIHGKVMANEFDFVALEEVVMDDARYVDRGAANHDVYLKQSP